MKRIFLLSTFSLIFNVLNAQCSIDLLNLTVGNCSQSSNSYQVNGQVLFTNAPVDGTLLVSVNNGVSTYDTIVLPPFVSPQPYSISDIPSDGNACTISVLFTTSASCSSSINFNSPETCLCTADVGTFTESTQTTSVSPNVLVFEDTFTLTSNQDYTFGLEVGGAGIDHEPGLAYMVFSCEPTTVDPALDPCLLGIIGTGESFSSYNNAAFINSFPFTPGITFYYAPITMYNVSHSIYTAGLEPCFEMGTAIPVQYLGPVVNSEVISNPNTGEVNFNVSGGLPEVNATTFTVSNVTPATAIVSANTLANNENLIISGLNNNDNWSVEITDDAGSVLIIGNEYLNVKTNQNLKINVFPNPVTDEIFIDGVTNESVLSLYNASGSKVIERIINSNSRIDLSEISKGIYTLVITDSSGSVSKRIIK